MKRLKSYYKEGHVDVEKCKLDFVGVIDFEATCTEVQNRNYPHEIIEFPIVLVDMKSLSIVSLQINIKYCLNNSIKVDHFSLYCKPIINPKLSSFCTQLTGITQVFNFNLKIIIY